MELVHNVKELQEDGREAAVRVAVRQVATVREPVPERQPFLLY